MKTRLICLLLTAIMVISCLAGCSQKDDSEVIDDVTNEASESASTLRMYLMSENKVDAKQAQAIEAEVNKITKAKFRTMVELEFYTAEDYYQKLEAAFSGRAEAEKNGTLVKPSQEAESTEAQTVETDYGTDLVYPTIADYQVDIFYLGGYGKYLEYSQMGMLQNLDSSLTNESKQISEFVSTAFLTYMKEANGGVYAIPANNAIGEYTYLLFNEDILSEAHYNTPSGLSMFDSITDPDLADYFAWVQDCGYAPLYTELSSTELAALGKSYSDEGDKSVKFWGVDANGISSEDFSVVASDYYSDAAYKEEDTSCMYKMGSFTGTAYYSFLEQVMKYRDNGYFADSAEDAAVICVKGGADLPLQYEGYKAVAIGTPTMQTMDLYNDMFAVSSYTSSTARSMEILTYLYTNDDFHNLLLYGVEGENYELMESEYADENGDYYTVVKRLKDTYIMAPEKVGNALIGYCLDDEDPALRDYVMQQNNDVVPSITMGFTFNYKGYSVDLEALKSLRLLSDSVAERLNACTSSEEFAAVMTAIRAELAEADNVKLMEAVTSTKDAIAGANTGVQFVYITWTKDMGIYVEPPEEF